MNFVAALFLCASATRRYLIILSFGRFTSMTRIPLFIASSVIAAVIIYILYSHYLLSAILSRSLSEPTSFLERSGEPRGSPGGFSVPDPQRPAAVVL